MAKAAEVKKQIVMPSVSVFNRWTTEGIEITDPGLRPYIGLKSVIVPRSSGRHAQHQFHKSQLNIVERFMNHMFVPGHRGKKQQICSGQMGGKSTTAWKLTIKVLDTLEQRTKQNPIQVLVKAIQNAALREEITSFQVGGIMVRRAVITSPQRRVDLALRLLIQAAFQKSTNNRKTMAQALTDEIMATFNGDAQNSVAIREKERIEREAAGAR
ncbi:MAG: 30S ribosomal protein S7 [Candidatus Aenigmatarchaeota archaeon]